MIGNIISKTEILRKNEIEFEFALKGKWEIDLGSMR